MSTKHTPGPWHAKRKAVYAPTPNGGGTRFVAASAGDVPMGTDEDSFANARLIAAAPELLEACKHLRRIVMDDYNERDVYREDVERATAAIAKATGD